MRIRIFLLASCVGLSVVGCQRFGGTRVVGSGVAKTETRKVSSFDAVKLVGAYNLEVTVGSNEPLTLTADDNILPVIATEVKDGRLYITLLENVRPKTTIVVAVSCADIRTIEGEGAGKITVHGVKNENFTVELEGGFSLHADGETHNLKLTITGAGDVDVTELHSTHATVSVTGAGNIQLHAEDTLNVSLTGAGSVRYLGDPKVTSLILGAGSVNKK